MKNVYLNIGYFFLLSIVFNSCHPLKEDFRIEANIRKAYASLSNKDYTTFASLSGENYTKLTLGLQAFIGSCLSLQRREQLAVGSSIVENLFITSCWKEVINQNFSPVNSLLK